MSASRDQGSSSKRRIEAEDDGGAAKKIKMEETAEESKTTPKPSPIEQPVSEEKDGHLGRTYTAALAGTDRTVEIISLPSSPEQDPLDEDALPVVPDLPLQTLPNELIFMVLHQCPPSTLHQARLVSHTFRDQADIVLDFRKDEAIDIISGLPDKIRPAAHCLLIYATPGTTNPPDPLLLRWAQDRVASLAADIVTLRTRVCLCNRDDVQVLPVGGIVMHHHRCCGRTVCASVKRAMNALDRARRALVMGARLIQLRTNPPPFIAPPVFNVAMAHWRNQVDRLEFQLEGEEINFTRLANELTAAVIAWAKKQPDWKPAKA